MTTDVLDYRIKLRDQANPALVVVFKATPELIETRNVNYKTVDPVHAPGQIYAYVNTSSRTFNLSSLKLISRTPTEAQENLRYLQLLRTWTQPAFGQDPLTSQQRENREELDRYRRKGYNEDTIRGTRNYRERTAGGYGEDLRGQPPAVLFLSAYTADASIGTLGHINKVPVVIQNLSIPFPADVDYIPSTTGVPMPTIMNVDMTLAETHSAREYEQFSLLAYKAGTLEHF